MTFEFYSNWWVLAKKNLEDLVARDQQFMQRKKGISDRNVANNLIGGLYVRYCLLIKDLAACYDQMVQPEKRLIARKLMDAALIRLNEWNNEMREISLSEVHYVDGNLIELKILPYDVEILHPMLFYPRPFDVEDMWQKLKKGERIFELPEPVESTAEVEKVGGEEQPSTMEAVPEKTPSAPKKPPPKTPVIPDLGLQKGLTPEEQEELNKKARIASNIFIIQTAERFRQERTYFFIKNLLHRRKRWLQSLPAEQQPKAVEKSVLEEAATKIQSVWKGYNVRQMMKFKEVERRLVIGMYEPSFRSKYDTEKYKKDLQKRRDYRDLRMREYLDSIDQEKVRILRVVGPGLLEDIEDEIREWFRTWYYQIKMFDSFPSEEKGGTILVVRGETMTPKEYLDEYERKRRQKVKNKGKDPEKEKAKQEKIKKKAEEKKKKEAEKKKKEADKKRRKKRKKAGLYEFEFDPTAMAELYKSGQEEYKEFFKERPDSENPLEKHYMEPITDLKCYEVQLETRKIADEMMRVELEILEEALEVDRIKYGGKRKKKKKGKKKGKKKKGKKGKKDITGHRKIEDLFQELFDNGIIRTYPEVYLDEYLGDYNYSGYRLRLEELDPPPCLLDLRQAVVMNCILPLGVTEMKKHRSVLICGPKETGKTMLANAVFNETRCVLFDLSPEVLAGKYPGKSGMKMLVHLVTKMSKILSPSIIYFEAAEKIFYKKVPKEEREMDPKRIGKQLIKGIIKPITTKDRVLVLGVTNKPWAAQGGKIKKAFERGILMPIPDYGSIYLYWHRLLMSYHGVDRNFNVTALTTMTKGYPLPVLKRVLESIMIPRRIVQLSQKPLTPQEIYEQFVVNQIEPVSEKEYKKFMKWYYKTPIGKDRKMFNKVADKKRKTAAKQQTKKK